VKREAIEPDGILHSSFFIFIVLDFRTNIRNFC